MVYLKKKIFNLNICLGVISGIDESTAFSWHFCTLCGDEELEERFGDKFICLNCLIELDDEILGTRMSLEIIVRLQKMKAQLKIKVGFFFYILSF